MCIFQQKKTVKTRRQVIGYKGTRKVPINRPAAGRRRHKTKPTAIHSHTGSSARTTIRGQHLPPPAVSVGLCLGLPSSRSATGGAGGGGGGGWPTPEMKNALVGSGTGAVGASSQGWPDPQAEPGWIGAGGGGPCGANIQFSEPETHKRWVSCTNRREHVFTQILEACHSPSVFGQPSPSNHQQSSMQIAGKNQAVSCWGGNRNLI